MWLNREAYERLLTAAAQSEFLSKALESAEKRAEDAERALQAERAAKDWQTLQLASRVVTKHGQYGLEHLPPPEPPKPNPQGYTHEPDEKDYAVLEFYKKCAKEAGKPEEDAVMRWEAQMRGEPIPIEMEGEQ